MIKNLLYSFILYLICLVLVFLYCLIVYFAGHSFWPQNASGSLIFDHNKNVRGSVLLAQNTSSERYFTSRMTHKSGNNCNAALYNSQLKQDFLKKFKANATIFDISSLTSSSSQLDPYIMKREALKQAPQIATARGIKLKTLLKIINDNALGKSPPFFELEIVNTTLLNSILDLKT